MDSCNFNSIEFITNPYSDPVISGCTLVSNGIGTAFQSSYGSMPQITENAIQGYVYPFHIYSNGLPTIQNNTIIDCVFEGIALSGNFTRRFYRNQKYVDVPDDFILDDSVYPYRLIDDLTILGKSFNITSGCSLDIQNFSIHVNSLAGTQNFSGQLNADSVYFTGDSESYAKIDFQGREFFHASGSFNHCEFHNIEFYNVQYSDAVISNSSLNGSNGNIAFTTTMGGTTNVSGCILSGYQYPFHINNHGFLNQSSNTHIKG